MKTNQTNQKRGKAWPLRKGETVVFLGQEYTVVNPGAPGLNAELRSTRSHDVLVFVNPAEFEIED